MLNQALPEQDLTFDDYVLVDTDIAVWGALSDAEIVTLDHNNTESDEDESEELTPVTLSEAKVSLKKLHNFFLQNHVDADILQASFVLEKSTDKPDGHGYELVSSVRALVPQKFSVEEELMHVKHVEVKSPHVGVMWKFGRGVISSGIVLVT
ncbi:hypothetical protein TNCV_3432671 [Trichonephila clavipes]|nr:hypothetical protein TNCV_3432671 [Trichonephila clavipes]